MANATAPLRDFISMRDAMDRLFDESFFSPGGGWLTWASTGARPLPLDIYETADDIVVRAVVPGVEPDAIDVQYQNGFLTIRATSPEENADSNWKWHAHEIVGGEAVRQVTLPRDVEIDHVQSSYKNGVLTLVLPKTANAKPKQIKVSPMTQIAAGTSAS
jgi:HSP20 family protein